MALAELSGRESRPNIPRKRKPEPFWRSERNCYFVQIGKRQVRLSPDEAEAWRLYHELMARPQELRKIEARFFDAENNRIVFPPSEAKGKKHHRIIYLGSARSREIVVRLCRENPNGPILLNSEGRPWNKDSINCAFCRIEKKIGRKLHLGAMRKGFTTEALKAGLDTLTVAHLLGHRDGTMVSRVYGKVQQDPAHMLDAARRAKKS